MMPIKVRLEEKDFAQLVRGKVVILNGPAGTVELILADIGWDRMYFHIERAMRDGGEGDLV